MLRLHISRGSAAQEPPAPASPAAVDAAPDPAASAGLAARQRQVPPQCYSDDAEAAALAFGCLAEAWAAADPAGLTAAVHPAACLRQPLQVVRGPGGLGGAALADLACLPEARAFREEAIVQRTGAEDASDPEDGRDPLAPQTPGHFVALRASLAGAHDGSGWLGPASGCAIRLRVMADLWCSGGQVRDGWILRDTSGALAQAGGVSPQHWARDRIQAAGGPEFCALPLTPDTDLDGPYSGRGRAGAHADALADRMRALLSGDFAALRREDDPACAYVLPCDTSALGARAATGFWAGLRSALPSAAIRVEHRCAATDPAQAPRAAVRWSLYGRHDGAGRFGHASGVYLHVMGMTQVEYGPLGVRRDWTLIDDCAVWTQILLATGDV